MSNVLQHILIMAEEQKAMFYSMSERVDDMEDRVKVILMKIEQKKDKIDQIE